MELTDLAGWLAIGIWLLRDWWHLRLRVVVAPVAAWMWTYLLSWAIRSSGYPAWGHLQKGPPSREF